jgi:hypothetical protein
LCLGGSYFFRGGFFGWLIGRLSTSALGLQIEN